MTLGEDSLWKGCGRSHAWIARIKDKAEETASEWTGLWKFLGSHYKKNLHLLAIKMKEFHRLLSPIPLVSPDSARGAQSQQRGASQLLATGQQDT